MNKRLFIVIVVVVVAALAVVFISRVFLVKPAEKTTASRVVTPQVAGNDEKANSNNSVMSDDAVLTSLVPLKSDETLISIVTMDFDGDGYEDQVNAIKTASSQYLSLLVGLYTPTKGTYERMAVIATPISQVKTFAYTGMDLTGEHKISLVYQGFTENGDSVLQAYFINRISGKFSLQQIADFKADGTIFIQQLDRYDAYERSQATGASFPIWVYSTDTAQGVNSTDQLQIRYDWSAEQHKYVLGAQIRVAGSKLAAKELARIQDGTVKTFAGFLNGLWYKTENDNSGLRYLFFDYNAREIIFLLDDTEEVYNWVNSNLRRNGIYLSTTNQEIENLQRRVDISLLGIDSVSLKLQDDVRMLIGENTLWDGEYKKMNFTSLANTMNATSMTGLKFIADLEKVPFWTIADGKTVSFDNGAYNASGENYIDNGNYTVADTDGHAFIQFRSKTANGLFNGTYLVTYAPLQSKGGDDVDYNHDSIILQPYTITLDGSFPAENRPVILTRDNTKK